MPVYIDQAFLTPTRSECDKIKFKKRDFQVYVGPEVKKQSSLLGIPPHLLGTPLGGQFGFLLLVLRCRCFRLYLFILYIIPLLSLKFEMSKAKEVFSFLSTLSIICENKDENER